MLKYSVSELTVLLITINDHILHIYVAVRGHNVHSEDRLENFSYNLISQHPLLVYYQNYLVHSWRLY